MINKQHTVNEYNVLVSIELNKNKTTHNFNIDDILAECNHEPTLVPYFIKLKLKELGIPVVIDPENIADSEFTVSSGELHSVINCTENKMTMEIVYEI